MKTVVTKEEIIAAIQASEMTAGQWIARGYPITGDCRVCAVGAVLRFALGTKATVRSVQEAGARVSHDSIGFVTRENGIKENLTAGNHLAALSCVYESAVHKAAYNVGYFEALDAGKAAAIAFVQQKFPDEIDVSVYLGASE